MPGSFFDTNVLIYLVSPDPAKALRAEQVVRQGGVISVQVLNETANVMRRKLKKSWAETHEVLSVVSTLLSVRPLTLEVHRAGLGWAERHMLSLHDAMLVASALDADCGTLWSEDMQPSMAIGGLTIRNPFVSFP